jgi:hypothetical protein
MKCLEGKSEWMSAENKKGTAKRDETKLYLAFEHHYHRLHMFQPVSRFFSTSIKL